MTKFTFVHFLTSNGADEKSWFRDNFCNLIYETS